MSDKDHKPPSKLHIFKASWMSIVILVASLAFVAESLTLKGDAGKYPLVVGLITATLCLLDLVIRFLIRRDVNKGHIGTLEDSLGVKLLIGAWIAATLALFYVIGVVATVAISGAAYFHLFVCRSLVKSALIGLAHAVAFWVAFDLLAGFNLYEGIFLN